MHLKGAFGHGAARSSTEKGSRPLTPGQAWSCTRLKLVWYFILLVSCIYLAIYPPWWPRLDRLFSNRLHEATQTPLLDKLDNLDSGLELVPFALEPLPLGSIKPLGWIKDQLQLMADGLAGSQYEFYDIVKHSTWVGGHSEYSPLNEALPYWLNGLVPLAYSIDNDRLKSQVLDALGQVLDRQDPDGWLGPEPRGHRDLWARFPLCLGLIQLVEADPIQGARIIPALHRFVARMHTILINGRGFLDFWGTVRYGDMIIPLQWLYENYPQDNAELLLDTMKLLMDNGFHWTEYWTDSRFIFQDLDTVVPKIGDSSYRYRHSHAVNVGQGLSTGATLYRFVKNESLLEANRRGVEWTFAYHGDVAGSIIGDEREAGLAPNRGSELCTAVETMYSLSYLYQVMGDNSFADRCELAAFNALPVSITGNHWARQYLAVANEPFAWTIHGPNSFYNGGAEALVYGLDTNYPCCTVNMPQGLPKFLSASFVRVGSEGVGHALLGPASVKTSTASGTAVEITCRTKYPFEHSLEYEVQASGSFTLYLRVPAWSLYTSQVSIPEENVSFSLSPDSHTGMMPISLDAGNHTVIYYLEADIRVETRGNASVSIYHGALLYALDVGQAVDSFMTTAHPNITYHHHESLLEVPDEVGKVELSNTKPWNVGIDPSTLVSHSSISEEDLANPIFDYEAPPTFITGKGCRIEWPLHKGLPAALSELPMGSQKRQCDSEVVDVMLRPYGSLKNHMAELPVVDLRSAKRGSSV